MQKLKNAAAVAMIMHVAMSFKSEGDAEHDALYIRHIANTPKIGTSVDIKLHVDGCACLFGSFILELANRDSRFEDVILQAAGVIKAKREATANDILNKAFKPGEN